MGGVVRNNVMAQIGGTGILALGGLNNISITGNTITNSKGVHSNGITAYGMRPYLIRNVLIAGNTVVDTARPITIEVCSNISIFNNVISLTAGTSAIACWGNCSNVFLLNNVLVSLYSNSITVTFPASMPGLVVKNNIVSYTIGGGDISNNIYTAPAMSSTPSPLDIRADLSTVFISSPRIYTITSCVNYQPNPLNQNTLYAPLNLTWILSTNDILVFSKDRTKGFTILSSSYGIFCGNWMMKIIFTPNASLINGDNIEIWPPSAMPPFSRDFRLRQGSPAIDRGIDVGQWLQPMMTMVQNYHFECDIIGTTRPQLKAWDIGAYEWFNSSSTPPGFESKNSEQTHVSSAQSIGFISAMMFSMIILLN